MSSALRHAIRELAPPAALLLLVLAAWQLAVVSCSIPAYLLPGPVQVIRAARQDAPELGRASAVTAAAAVSGFAASLLAGVLTAVVFSQSRVIRNSCYPYAIFLQTMPIVAIAPLIITWFGYGFLSVVIVAAVISLFPVITTATAGMVEVSPSLLELFRVYDAGRWQVLTRLRLPNAVPGIITGAKTSSGLAVVGAIVGEFFVGAGSGDYGLGFLIRREMELFRTASLLAAVIASAVLGVAIFAAVGLLGAWINKRWYNS